MSDTKILEKYMKNGIAKTRLARTSTPVKIGLIALTLAGSQIVAAAEPGWYAGANIGQSQADMDNDGIVARQLANGFRTSSLRKHDSDNAFKVFGGYRLSDYIALEAGYFDLGEFSYKAFTNRVTPPNAAGVFTADTKLRGLNIDLVGFLPLNERLSAFGRIGATRYENKDSFRGFGAMEVAPFGNSNRETSHKFGAGLQYDFNENLAMRVEAERYDIEDVMLRDKDVDMYSVGLVYRFGAPAAAPEPVRAPVSAAPAPAPTPAPTPPPTPEPVRVTLSADTLFAFDSATVTPAGRAELDTLATELRSINYDSIVVTGHADRIGSQSYNMALSNRRAVAVRDYLVSAARIDAAKISTRGVNSNEPVTTLAQCGNQLARAQLIACLAPDRRVEVEVTGSRPR
jgi:OmpA-OmpF porin, OOP family